MGSSPPSVVISYVPEDEASLHALEKQLEPLRSGKKIASWSARRLSAGDATAEKIAEQLAGADVIVLLLSADYLASETAVREMAGALRRRRAAGARLVPVLARPCFVEETPLGALQALP